MISTSALRAALLATVAGFALLPVAANAAPANDTRLDELQEQLDALNAQVEDLKRSSGAQYTDYQTNRAKDVQLLLKNGRPTFTSGDGDFSLSLRTLLQYDTAYYAEGTVPAGIDFASGSNFRRARIGVSGTVFADWTYEFLYDLGGSGVEGASLSSAYVQYNGLAPLYFRIGAYAPPQGFDDQTSASDLLFLERSQPTDAARSLAAADGRNAVTVFAYDDNYFLSGSWTGAVVGEAATFDEQQAFVGRGAYRFIKTADANLAIGGDISYVYKLADTTAGPALSTTAARLRARPELNLDANSNRLIDTGAINADSVLEWGIEAAGNWQNFYAQGGYYNFDIARRASPLVDPSFDGWYLQGSWVLTGEAKPYNASKAAYGLPTPAEPFSLSKAGIGAWELAGRYSVFNLDYNAGVGGATPVGGVRGGEQRIWTVGLNWYPNNAIRFQLNYQITDVSRLAAGGANNDADLDAVSLRAQLSL